MTELCDVSAVSFSAGIIAAGDGLRLKDACPGIIKPLVPIRGTPLIHWTATSLAAAGAQEIVLLLNSRGREARKYLEGSPWPLRWAFLEADTPSSWESFRLVSRVLGASCEWFLISTVDALIPAKEIARFVKSSLNFTSSRTPSAALALTRFVEDEKPLWADVDNAGRITAFGSSCRRHEFVTCGLYAINRPLAMSLQKQQAHGSLREFWIAALKEGISCAGIPLAKTVDVDRPEDLPTAEQLVASWEFLLPTQEAA